MPFSSIATHCFNWLLPQSCFLCGDMSQRPVCEDCLADLPYQQTACTRCARVLPAMGECYFCQKEPPPFTHTQAIFRYDYPVNKLIQVAKFHHNLAILKLLGDIMGDKMSHRLQIKERPDVLIPVPLHPKRLRKRGYNQSLELAKRIAKATGIPVNYIAVERCRDTEPQTNLPVKRRKTNLIGAFRVRQIEPHWKHIVLVDDVMTTGATVRELAKIFLQAGVPRVDVWCCARTGW